MKRAVKKFIPLLVLLSVSLFIFFPFSAKAGPIAWLGGVVGGALGDVATDIIQAVSNLIILGIATLLDMAYQTLQWVISPNFLDMTMTGPDNPLVYNAWAWVRDLANIFLVLGLIVIALGIILGIKEYEAKRTLPVLIIIALLINFTPVICGWIIDFSNYLMKHLLTGGFNNGFVQAISDGLQSQAGEKSPIKAIIDSLVFDIFGIVSIVVIFLYCLLFLIRYVFLWVLIIFSPIAFVSRVFGPNRYIRMFFPGFLYWDNWWVSFIQWCVIGIFGAFFIFLANKSMVDWMITTSSSAPSILAGLAIYIFPILILLIGFFATISAASEGMGVLPGSKVIIAKTAEKAQKGARWAGKKVGEAVPESARRKGEEWSRYTLPTKWGEGEKGLRGRLKRGWSRLGRAQFYGKGEAGAKGWMKRRIGQLGTAVASPYIVAKQSVGKAVSAPAKIEKEDISKAFRENLGKPVEEQLKAYNKPTALRGERIGTLQAIIHDNNLDDAKMLMKAKEKEKFEEEIKRDMGEAALIGDRASFNKIARANPHYIDDVATRLNSEIRKRMSIEPSREELLKAVQEREKEKPRRLRERAEELESQAWEKREAAKQALPAKKAQLIEESLQAREEARMLRKEADRLEKGIAERHIKELDEIEELREKGKKQKAEERMNEFLKENYSFIPQIIKGIKPETVGDMSAESLGLGKGPEKRAGESDEEFNKRKEKYDQAVKEVWGAIHKHWLPENNVAAIKIFKKMFADKYMEGAKERGTMWYVVNNPTMATYLTSMFAPESGLFAPEKITLQQINAWQDQLNRLSPEIRSAFEEAFNQLKDEQRKNLEEALKKNPEILTDKELKDISEQKTLEGKIEKLEDKINKWTNKGKE